MMVAVTLLAINQGNSQAEITLASLVPIIKQFYYLWKSLSKALIELEATNFLKSTVSRKEKSSKTPLKNVHRLIYTFSRYAVALQGDLLANLISFQSD